jgi:putative exosortase-associated protein (TIGR04073 family)
MNKVISILACILLLSAAVIPTAHAASRTKTVSSSDPQEVLEGMSHKFVRGIASTATGIGELPKQIYLTTVNEGGFAGATIGPLKGIGMFLVRTVTGVIEVATFFFPLPGFYDPIIYPEYVWQKE